VQRKAKPSAQLPEPRKLRQKVKEMAMKMLAHLSQLNAARLLQAVKTAEPVT
jgi:hypothetical protein